MKLIRSDFSALCMTLLLVLGGLIMLPWSTMNSRANPVTPSNPVSGDIVSGVVNFTCASTNADSVEILIDGVLIATMSGGPTWYYEINTSGWSDGSHIIRYDSTGDTTDNIISVPVKFDNSGPLITDPTTLYPSGQTTAKPTDRITVTANVVESVSSISTVQCDASMIGGASAITMHDDGLHNDGAPNDDVYGTELINVTVGGGYRAAYVHARDTMGNLRNVTAPCNVDQYEPTILEIDTILPAGQTAVKNGDAVRVTAKVLDYKILIAEVVERKPLDVVLVLDNSGSMRNSNGSGGMMWDDLEYASTTFIDTLADDDRCAIVSFNLQGSNEDAKQYSTFLQMDNVYTDPWSAYTSTGRNVSKHIITVDDGNHLTEISGQPNCWTPIWDSIGMAIQYALNNRRTDAVPLVIAMTDGDDWGIGGREFGSETYCPGASDGATGQTWTVSGGCIWDSPPRSYPSVQRETDTNPNNALTTITFGGGQPERSRTGLINATIPVFTIGLGISPQGSNSSLGNYLSPGEGSYRCTTEFDLASIANSSVEGKYYYAPSSTDLYDIYNNVSQVIQKFGASTLGTEQPRGIDSLQADLSSVGITLKVNMFDDGEHADGKEGDNIYGSEWSTVNSLDTGTIVFHVEGTDTAGNVNGTQYTIRLDNIQPTVNWVNTSYPPGRTKAQDGYSIYVVANCTDSETGAGKIYLDASNIGGSTQVPMRDDGTHNDEYAYDGDFTSDNVTVATGLVSGVYTYTVNAYDKAGNVGSQSGNIDIFNDVDIIMSNLAEGNIISGDYQIIANITDPDGVPDTATNPRYRVDANAWNDMSLISGTEFGALINTSLYLDGEHTLYVNARDPFGAESTLEIGFIIDNTLPFQCVVVSPIASEFIEGLYSFRVTATDAIGINNVSAIVLNGTGIEVVSDSTMGFNSDSGYYELSFGTANLPDGSYGFIAYARDKAGHLYQSAPRDFRIDNNYPEMTINAPRSGQIVYGMFEVNVSVSDAFLDILEYNIDSSGWINSSTDWNTTLFSDGAHTMEIRARDEAAHEVSVIIRVTVDNHDPMCSLNLPSQHQFIDGIYTFGAIVSDEVGLRSVRAEIKNNISDEIVLNTSMSYNAGTGYYECIFDTTGAPDGNYTAAVYALDLADNLTESVKVDFYIDNNAPSLTIGYPLEGDIVSGIVPLNVTLSEEPFLRSLEYNIDSSGWVNVTDPWDTMAIADGPHAIEIRARDLAGHETRGQIEVIVDNNDPEAHIISPIADEYIGGIYVFKISGSDEVGIENVVIYVSSGAYNATYNTQSSCYEVSLDTTLWDDGTDYISARVHDRSNRSIVISSRRFHIDNYAPEIDINYPGEMNYVEGSVVIRVNVRDHFGSLCTSEYNVDNKGWIALFQDPINSTIDYSGFIGYWNTSQVTDAMHSIDIRAADKAGHVTDYTISVIVDNNEPTCEIHTPIENQYMEGVVTLKVKAADECGISRVVLDMLNEFITASYNTQTGYYEYSLDTTVILEDGLQSVSAVAYDLSGKVAYDGPVLFNVDNTPPKLLINSPRNLYYLNRSVDINATTIDSYPLPTEYNVDSSGWHDIGVPWDTTKTTDGSHSISIRARDAIGHETMETITVTVDNHFPECTIHSPTRDQFVEDSMTLKVLASDTLGIERVELNIFIGSQYEKIIEATYNSVTNYYEYTQSLYGIIDGAYDVGVTAYDRSLNSITIVPVRFRVDGNYPTLNINKPSNGAYLTGTVEMSMNSADAFDTIIEYNVDKGGWNKIIKNTTNLWSTDGYRDGLHEIEVRAIDESGHVTTRTLAVKVDNSQPDLTIVTPRTGDHLTGINTVKVYCHDALSIESVSMSLDNGTALSVFLNPVTGLYEIPLDTTKYADGAHTLIITARDHVGNSKIGMAAINFDNMAPDVMLERIPSEGKGAIEFRVDNTDNATKMYINIEGSGWKEMSYDETDDSFWYIWSTTVDDNGKHAYQIKAVDEYGNEKIRSDVITVENEVSYLSRFTDALPFILFIILLLFIGMAIFVLVRTGRARKWLTSGKKEKKPTEKDKRKTKEKKGSDILSSDDESDPPVAVSAFIDEIVEDDGEDGKKEKADKKKTSSKKPNRKKKAGSRPHKNRNKELSKRDGRYQDAADDVEELGGWIEESMGDEEDEEEWVITEERKRGGRRRWKGPERGGGRDGRYRVAADEMDEVSGWIEDDDFLD